jgi:hypothetical protein
MKGVIDMNVVDKYKISDKVKQVLLNDIDYITIGSVTFAKIMESDCEFVKDKKYAECLFAGYEGMSASDNHDWSTSKLKYYFTIRQNK